MYYLILINTLVNTTWRFDNLKELSDEEFRFRFWEAVEKRREEINNTPKPLEPECDICGCKNASHGYGLTKDDLIVCLNCAIDLNLRDKCVIKGSYEIYRINKFSKEI